MKPEKNMESPAKEEYRTMIKEMQALSEKAYDLYFQAVKEICVKHNVWLATGHLSDTWQWKKPRGKIWHLPYDVPDSDPVFKDLEELEIIGEDFRIGPSNMEMVKP